ncbi:sugar phosphate isomerase/epimerase [bacterium]|nr:sugar phosphate isomerase/epimerase [bacterium]
MGAKNPIISIGINGHPSMWEGDLNRLEDSLKFFESIGFDHVEIPPHGLDVIAGGRLIEKRLEEIKRILGQFRLNYTVHAPDFLNLMDVENADLHKSVFIASLEFTSSIGGRLLVYHGGRVPVEYAKDKNRMEELKSVERMLLREFSELASKSNILIGVENSNVDPAVASGKVYTYSAFIDQLVEQIIKIERPNIGITFDFGHASVASIHFGFDYLSSIKQASPYVNSLHVYDSFGRPNNVDKNLPYMFQLIYGLNDLHLPLGWGNLPLEEVFTNLEIPQVFMTLEIHPRFKSEYVESLKIARYLASLARERCI